MDTFWEIFTLLTGLLYLILEIRQHNFMWIVGVITALAAMYVFFRQSLYASFALNCYYLAVSFVGLWQWRKDSATVSDNADDTSSVRIRSLTWQVVAVSLFLFVLLTLGFGRLASLLGDPMSHLDVAVAVISAIATFWLSRSYKEQWLLWIVADAMSTGLCISQKLWWLSVLYAAYTLSAFYGYHYWRSHGRGIS